MVNLEWVVDRLLERAVESGVTDDHDHVAIKAYFMRAQKIYLAGHPGQTVASYARAYSAAMVYLDEMSRTYAMLEGRR